MLCRASLLTLLIAGAAAAQPPVGEQPRPREDARQGEPGRQPIDGPRAKERLDRRLAELTRAEEIVREAQRRIDAGESPADVMREADEATRSLFREAMQDRFRSPRPERGGEDQRPQDGEPRGPGGWRGGPLSQEEREKIAEFVKEHLPVLHGKLETIRANDPAAADRLLMRLAPRVREALSAQRRDPDLFRLRVDDIRAGLDVIDAVTALREARQASKPAEQLTALRETLRGALMRQFDVRIQLQEFEVQALKKRIASIESEVASKKERRSELVDELASQMENSDFRKPGPRDDGPGSDAGPGMPQSDRDPGRPNRDRPRRPD